MNCWRLGRAAAAEGGRDRCFLCAVAAALFVSLAAMSPAAATVPGHDGLIAYVSHGSPVSPDRGIVVVGADGSGLRGLTSDARDRSPAWSPDGSRLVFARAGRLYLIGADGTGLRPIAPRINGAGQPAWSADGRSLALVRESAIYVTRFDSSGLHRIFARAGALVDRLSWSPDGRWIAFGLSGEGYGGSIVVVRGTGGATRYLTDGRAGGDSLVPGDLVDDAEPDWSPAGTRLAFTRNVWLCGSKCDQNEVFSVRADGADARWITTDTGYDAHWPTWAPSGKQIVAETSRGIATFTAAGRLIRVLDPAGTEPAWQSLG